MQRQEGEYNEGLQCYKEIKKIADWNLKWKIIDEFLAQENHKAIREIFLSKKQAERTKVLHKLKEIIVITLATFETIHEEINDLKEKLANHEQWLEEKEQQLLELNQQLLEQRSENHLLKDNSQKYQTTIDQQIEQIKELQNQKAIISAELEQLSNIQQRMLSSQQTISQLEARNKELDSNWSASLNQLKQQQAQNKHQQQNRQLRQQLIALTTKEQQLSQKIQALVSQQQTKQDANSSLFNKLTNPSPETKANLANIGYLILLLAILFAIFAWVRSKVKSG